MRKCFSLLLLASQASYSSAAEITHQRLNSGIELIAIVGEIESGDETKFKKLAIQFDKAIVGFSSNGGALLPALEIGTALRLRGFDTAVIAGNQCASACALIWAAGVNRYIVKGGRVGFHASYVEDGGKAIETGLGNALVGRYLAQLGLSQRATIFATASNPNSMTWLSKESDAAYSGFSFNFSLPARSATNSARESKIRATTAATSYVSVEGWDIYKNETSCTAVASFKSNNAISVRYFAKTHGVVVGFSYPEGTSLKEGDKRTANIVLVKPNGSVDDGWRSIKFTTRVYDGIPVLNSDLLDDPALSDIKSAKQIGFFYKEKLVTAFPLNGIHNAITEVTRCSQRVNGLNSTDVFAE